jgi:fatty acid desaturase
MNDDLRTRHGVASRQHPDAYAQLKRVVSGRGLLERRPSNEIVPAAGIVLLVSLIAVGVALTRASWWALAWTAPAALLFGQLGFLAHDAVHNQIFRTSRANYSFGLLLFNLCLGGSRGWWAEKHNAHHAQPNRLGADPDIEGGVVAVSEEQSRLARGFTRFMIRHQAATIGPLLALSVVQIHAYSAWFLRDRRLRHPRVELTFIAVHYAVYFGGLTMVLGVVHGLLFAAMHQLLLGLYLGGAFLPNHVGMPVLSPDAEADFLHRQVVTSRNIRAGRCSDYLFGGLSSQVEHHLFPTMPRHHLRKAAPIVRRFCAEQGIDYCEMSPWDAYRQVFHHLRIVARAAGARSSAHVLLARG